MSICKNCGYIGGYHGKDCPVPHAPIQYTVTKTNNTATEEAA